MTCADTGCDWLKQFKTFHGCLSVSFWLKQNSFETVLFLILFQFYFSCAELKRIDEISEK